MLCGSVHFRVGQQRGEMPLTPEAAREVLRKGESQTVEFKTRPPDAPTLARLIAAFANSEGGTIFVGAGDHGEVLGADLDEVGRVFHAALASIRNPPRVDLEAVTLDGKHVATITVTKSDRLVLAEDGAFTRVRDHVEVMSVPAISQALKPQTPDDLANVAAALHDLTATVKKLGDDIAYSNSFRGQLQNYIVGGVTGAILGVLLTALLGL
jgi:hypothetical protein